MRFLGLLARFAFFFLVLWFALKNTTPVPLRLSEGLQFDGVPLVVIILGCLMIGAVAGAGALALRLFRLRRQLEALRRQVQHGSAAAVEAERFGDRLASAARDAGAAGPLDGDTLYPRKYSSLHPPR